MIKEFNGRYRFLSNFWPCFILYQNKIWPSSEHLYQSLKTDEENIREEIRLNASPSFAKKIGKKLELRNNWNQVKDAVMEMVVWLKFRQNKDLRQQLINTGSEELQEGNWWGDTYYGVNLHTGVGLNILGKILEKTRSNIIEIPDCGNCNSKGWTETDGKYYKCSCSMLDSKPYAW